MIAAVAATAAKMIASQVPGEAEVGSDVSAFPGPTIAPACAVGTGDGG